MSRGQFFRVLTAGDPPPRLIPEADNRDGDFTLQELLAVRITRLTKTGS